MRAIDRGGKCSIYGFISLFLNNDVVLFFSDSRVFIIFYSGCSSKTYKHEVPKKYYCLIK